MKSIALKLWLGMMALVAVVLILLWLFQIVFLNNFYTQMRVNEIKSSGLDIIKEIGNRQEFENRLDELAYNNNLTAELLDLGYNTVYTAGATGMNGQMPMLLLSFLLSKSFTKPILDITKVFMDMASGNLSARIKSGRKDEIGRLAETINYMEKELSKIDQLRKDLIANVSHELRTPLSLIKGYAETIRDIS